MSMARRHLLGLAAALALTVPAAPAVGKVEGDTVTLGAALSLTGRYATEGQQAKHGYDLAVKRINEMGGVKVGGKSYRLEIKYYDDESSNERAASLAERLIAQDGIKFVLGPYSSPLTAAVAPITEKYRIPMVEANGASRSLFTKGFRYLFAVLSTSDQYLSSAVELAAEKAKEEGRAPSSLRLALAMGDDSFSLDVRAGILEAAKAHNMQIVVDDKVPDGFTDISATLARVKAVKPDLFLVSGHAKGAATATRQIAEAKVDVPMLAMTHCDAAQIAEKFAAAAEFTLCASQWAPTLSYSDRWFGAAAKYDEAFRRAYSYDATYQAAESSAAVLVFHDAFERAQSFETDKVRDALAATNLATFFGQVKFDETGKNLAKPMVLFQVQKGDYLVVAPTKWATAKLVHPRPIWAKRGS